MKIRKTYNEIYTEVVQETDEFFQELARKQNQSMIISFFIGIAICIFLYKSGAEYNTPLIFVLFLIIIFLGIVFNNTYYRNRYKQEIIGRFVKKYDINFRYYPKERVITKHDYFISKFDKDWNEIETEDGIKGTLDDGSYFRMAQVTIIKKVSTSIDSFSEETEKQVKFKGTFCIVELKKPIINQIDIIGNTRKYKYSKDRVEVDSEEFEREYDLMAEDRIQALRIFTPDIIEKLVGIKKRTKSNFRIRIMGEYLFIRIENGDIFEPISYEGKIAPRAFLEYYNTLDVPIIIAEAIIDGAKEL